MTNFKQITQLIALCIPSLFLAQENFVINKTSFGAEIKKVDKNILITTTPEQSIIQIAGSFELHNTKGSTPTKITIKPLFEGHKIFILHNSASGIMRKGSEEGGYRTRVWACLDNDEHFPGTANIQNKATFTITAHPNPVNNELHVNSEIYKIIHYQLVDMHSVIKIGEQTSSNNIHIDVSTITKGTYYLKVLLENQEQQIKRIIKN